MPCRRYMPFVDWMGYKNPLLDPCICFIAIHNCIYLNETEDTCATMKPCNWEGIHWETWLVKENTHNIYFIIKK